MVIIRKRLNTKNTTVSMMAQDIFNQYLNSNCPKEEKVEGPNPCSGSSGRSAIGGQGKQKKSLDDIVKMALEENRKARTPEGVAATKALAIKAEKAYALMPKRAMSIGSDAGTDLWEHAAVDGASVQSLLDLKRSIAVKDDLTDVEMGVLRLLNEKLDKVDFMGGMEYYPKSDVNPKSTTEKAYKSALLVATVEDLRTGKSTPEELKSTVKTIEGVIQALKKHDGQDGITYSDGFKKAREKELRDVQHRMITAIRKAKE
jgi:DNA-binding cell septation regulator SpoVG